MSNFMDAVGARMTGTKFAPMWPMEPLTVTKDVKAITFTELSEYDIGVHWKIRVTCAPETLPKMIENVKHQLRVAVYGEFRDVLIRLERALYEHDQKAALSELKEAFKRIES